MLTRLRTRLRRSLLGRARRRLLAHRRLVAFLLVTLAVASGLAATRPAPPPTTTITVAARDLPAGVVLGPDDVTPLRVAPEAVPAGALPDPVGEVLAAPLRRGEPVTDVRLVSPALVHGHPGLTAVPVRFGDAEMAALLRVGDVVDVYATDPATARTSLASPGARVLALPQGDGSDPGNTGRRTPGNGVTSAGAGRLVVVGVPHGDVTTLTAAGVSGFLTFAYSH